MQPHEQVRGGTSKLLTLFHPAIGQVHAQPTASCTNPVVHGWLKAEQPAILAAPPASAELADAAASRAARTVRQDGLAESFTLHEQSLPRRVLRVWDNRAGHKSPGLERQAPATAAQAARRPLPRQRLGRSRPD